MIREHELLEAIAECQGQKNPNSSTCLKLASYYTILDHMKVEEKPTYSYAEPMYDSGTEFSNAIQGMSTYEVMEIMDELMTTLSIVNPRLYAGVMRKF